MNELKIKYIFIVLIFYFFSPLFLLSETVPSDVMAKVDDVSITEKELLRRVNSLINREFFHRNLPPEKEKEIKEKALNDLIKEELIFQAAKKQNIKADKKVIKGQLRKLQKKFKSKADFKKSLKAQGLTLKDIKEKIKREYLIKEAYRKNVLEKVIVNKNDLKEYYSQNIASFKKPESVDLQHILIKVNDPVSDSSWKDAFRTAMGLISRLESGEDFGVLAGQFSRDMYRIKGGHLGYVHRGRLLPEVEEFAFSMETGAVSRPIKTHLGYHIIKVIDKKESYLLKFSEVKDKLRSELKKKNEEEIRDRWIAGLKKQADIRIFFGLNESNLYKDE